MPRTSLIGPLVVVASVAMGCSGGDADHSARTSEPASGGARASGDDSAVAAGFVDRAHSYLQAAAKVEPSADDSRGKVWRAVARLALDAAEPVDLVPADFATIDERFATFTDTTDFDMIALINLWYRSDKGQRLSADTRAHVKDLILGFKYWYTEPQPDGIVDERWYWSENHQILFHANEYLAGQAFPDETFTNNGQTGRQHREHAAPLIDAWVDHRARWGFAEWYSNVYYQEDLEATVALAEFAADEPTATRGAIASDLVLVDLASHTFKGAFGATHGRTYKKDKMTALDEDTWEISKLVLDDTDIAEGSALGAVYLASASTYRPPAVVSDILTSRGDAGSPDDAGGAVERARHSLAIDPLAPVAADPEGPMGLAFDDPDNLMTWWGMGALTPWQTVVETTGEMTTYDLWKAELFSDFAPFEPIVKSSPPDQVRALAQSLAAQLNLGLLSEANTYTWRSPGAMLSTAQDFRKGQASQQHHIWQATFSPQAQAFTTHPRVATPPDTAWHSNTDDWTGSATLPRSVQYRNVNITMYAPGFRSDQELRGSYMDYTHAYLPQDAFDEVARSGRWTFARLGDNYLALYSWRPPEWVTYDPARYDTNGLTKPFELVAAGGPNNVWITEIGSAAQHGSFAAFQQAIAANEPEVHPLGDPDDDSTAFDVSWASPSAGPITFGWDAPLVVDGATQALGDYPRIDAPWGRVPFDSTSYDLRAGGHSLRIDTTKPSRTSR